VSTFLLSFLQSHRDHRDLHSFPTRRSSDLGKPALIIKADFPRRLYSNGERILDNMYFFLLLTGLMTGIGVKFALDRLFVSRIIRSEEHTSELQSRENLVCRLLLEKKKKQNE